MRKSLVAFDTDRVKQYVFATDKLKEIRGASSLLDRLNRQEMKKVADDNHIAIDPIYTNGGSGLFLVDADRAKEFGRLVQRVYRKYSKGTASITYVVQELPPDAPTDIEALMDYDLCRELELVRYHLREEKGCPPCIISLPSHPFMRPCDACGIEYAAQEYHASGEPDTFYCVSCRKKQVEDGEIKERIRYRKKENQAYVWDRILSYLDDVEYELPSDPERELDRPNDFNEFSQFTKAKHYLGLIYADGNGMGKKIERLRKLKKISRFADRVDRAIHQAMSRAIKAHLPIVDITRDGEPISVFPFDILLVGGDDIVMVTDAAKALDVALTIAQEFRQLMRDSDDGDDNEEGSDDNCSVSIGVVLAPIKYPFGLLQDMADSALKFAKKVGSQDKGDPTRINFLVVTGGSKPDFKLIYRDLYQEIGKHLELHATLRPYKPEDLRILLDTIREGNKLNLGRTKLHQLREAVLEKNLATSVDKGLASLRNWRDKQRSYIVRQVYEFGGRYQMPRSDPHDPVSEFPRVTFPWFADGVNEKGRHVYRTSLLDFIELYDFVSREGEASSDES